MRLIKVDQLVGNEILAVPVLAESEAILIQSDIRLNKEYIQKLIAQDVEFVYIKEKTDLDYTYKKMKSLEMTQESGDVSLSTVDQATKETKKIVKNVLERHIYKHNAELKKIGQAAEKILDSVLSEPMVIKEILEIRELSTDISTHCTNVCTLATIMGIRMNMTEKQVKNIAMGAILHDIGLKYIVTPYFNMDPMKMNQEEVKEYKKHTIYGYSSIQDETWLPNTSKEIILLHHEKADGSGFPFQQKWEKLRPEVRLVSLCDDFDSFISGVGARKMKIYEAVEYLRVHAVDFYDVQMAEALLESVALYPVGMTVITNEGETGVVVRQNQEATDRPVLKMIKHSDGSDYTQDTEKDLMKILTLFIVDTQQDL